MPFTKIDIVKAKVIFFTIFIIVRTLLLHAQPTPRGQPDVSNKTLITNANQDHVMGAAALHKLANDYYNWRNESDTVSSSNAGLHTWDDKLADLQNPVKLYAKLAIDSARAIDPLLNQSLMALDVDLAPTEHEELIKARDAALAAAHSFADELEKRMPKMVDFAPMGEANYNYYLKHVLLLPLDAREVETIGRVENGRYRALEAQLSDPKLADPDPSRSTNIPPDQASFLKAYESREQEMINFLKEHNLITLPDYLGPFQIRQLPEAFKPTSPGGFMNPPGVYDKDPI